MLACSLRFANDGSRDEKWLDHDGSAPPFVVLLHSAATGATYRVDNRAGSDEADGTVNIRAGLADLCVAHRGPLRIMALAPGLQTAPHHPSTRSITP
jgi:hypothetical protein